MRYLIILFLFVGQLHAQYDHDPYRLDSRIGDVVIGGGETLENDSNSVKKWMLNNIGTLQQASANLKLLHTIESPGGSHYLFQQVYNETPIFKAFVKAGINKRNVLYSLFDHSVNVSVNPTNNFPQRSVALEWAGEKAINVESLIKFEVRNVYFPINGQLLPAIAVEILDLDNAYEVVLDITGRTLYTDDFTRTFTGKDSTVSAMVFLPDPLTTANVSYGPPYVDANDASMAVLDVEMVNVDIAVDYENGVFSLVGPYVRITNYRNSNHTPATSTSPFFHYNRAQQEFEDINVFYHITNYQQYVQGIGFTNLANYAIDAETHASTSDNSTFVHTFNPPRLSFGEGGVDDAEDADVIIHEYGHAIQYDAAPLTVTGFERKALDEANSDYFAASYSRSLNDFNWEKVFSWDGHNEFFSGRIANSTKHYPEDLGASFHRNGEIWSSAMMEVWEELGQTTTDQLLLQSLYDYSINMTFSQAAMLVIMADSNLFDGAHTTVLCNIFNKRGFSTTCNDFVGIDELVDLSYEVLSTDEFAGGRSAIFNSPVRAEFFTWTLTNASGQIVKKGEERNTNQFPVSGEGIRSGFYILTVVDDRNRSSSFKLIRGNN